MIDTIKAILFANHKDVKLLRAIIITLYTIFLLWGIFAIGGYTDVMMGWTAAPYFLTSFLLLIVSVCTSIRAWGNINA